MLASVWVNGFKSLSNFSLQIRPGLNVLVGPNGAGKTNILKFFEFLSELTTTPLAEAVSKLGGAGEIFRRKDAGVFESKISYRVHGAGEATRFNFPRESGPAFIAYELSGDIILSKDLNALYYDRQTIRACFAKSPLEAMKEGRPWQFEFVFKANSENGSTELVSYDARHLKDYFRFDRKQFLEFISEIQSNSFALRQFLVVGMLAQIASPLRQITSDISSGKAYNIQPDKVRQAEDIAQPPIINFDGSGFAATLFALKTPQQQDRFWWYVPAPHRRQYRQDSFQKIQNYSRLINDSIVDIDVKSDPLENKLKVVTRLRSSGNEIDIPLSFLSDGTVKWLSLVTAVITSRSIFAIEEPENFLHPRMQEEIVKIVRSVFAEARDDRFAIMTTHSETLLNSLNPEELIITSMEDGNTVARTPRNAQEVYEEIRRTGFGLGFYYISGAIE